MRFMGGGGEGLDWRAGTAFSWYSAWGDDLWGWVIATDDSHVKDRMQSR